MIQVIFSGFYINWRKPLALSTKMHYTICRYADATRLAGMLDTVSSMLIATQIPLKCRRVGMADEEDSKSFVGNHVGVQVPSPAPAYFESP